MIHIKDKENFIAKDIFECGQVFRYKATESGYEIISKDKLAIVDDGSIICADDAYFYNYFDFDRDYGKIISEINTNSLLNSATDYGKGIRILRQDKFETLISFIISSNNHIPRIKGIIERLCIALGEKKHFSGIDYYAFPTPEIMAKQTEDFYKSMGLGYRAGYILSSARSVHEGFDLNELDNLSTQDARKMLCSLLGVGPKVADCILLFAYSRFDSFPVDTWMEKVYYDYFESKRLCAKDISKYFVEKYGDLSGFVQQYLFYYKKNLEEK